MIAGWVFTTDTGMSDSRGNTNDVRNLDAEPKQISTIHRHPILQMLLAKIFGSGRVKNLPDSSWARAKGPAEVTYEHVDYHFFYKNSTIISDHMRLPSVKIGRSASSIIRCAICNESHNRRDLNIRGEHPMAWHCNVCVNKETSIWTIWIPLTDIGVNDSKLAIVAGSHMLSGYEAFHGELPGQFTATVQSKSVWHLPAGYKMGDIVMFNIKTVHAATKNYSDRYRLSVDARIAILHPDLIASANEPRPSSFNTPQLCNAADLLHFKPQSKCMIMHTDAATGLEFNCAQLSTEMRTSTIAKAGRGLFTSADYTAPRGKSNGKRVIAYMFGIIRSRVRLSELIAHPLSAADSAEMEFVADYAVGVHMMYDITDWLSDGDDDYVMLISRQCPMGLMNDPRNGRFGTINTVAQIECDGIIQMSDRISWTSIVLTIPDVDLAAGSELFVDYGWDDATWKRVASKMKMQLPATVRTIQFRTQWQGVMEFMQLRTSIEVMQKFRYAACVADFESTDIESTLHVALRASTAVPGLLGVIIIKQFKGEM